MIVGVVVAVAGAPATATTTPTNLDAPQAARKKLAHEVNHRKIKNKEGRPHMAFVRPYNRKKRNESNLHTPFHERFQDEYTAFLQAIQGPSSIAERERLTSLTLTRLMFVYFIQKKGF